MWKIFLSHTKRDLELFYHPEAVKKLKTLGEVVKNLLAHLPKGDEQLLRLAGDADVIITEWNTGAGRLFFENVKHLKAFIRCGVTTKNIDVEAATRAGVLVINTPNNYTIPMAELTIGFMISLARNIIPFHNDTQQGKIPVSYNLYIRDQKLLYDSGFELSEKTVGIVGLGDIGKKVAKFAHLFNMKVLAYDPYVKDVPAYIKLVDLKELMQRSRFVTIHCKYTEETEYLINQYYISLMRPDAYIINTARGLIIEEEALVKALKNNKIAGAALDVFATEPEIKNSHLLNLSNVIITPHIGANTPETMYRQAIRTAEITETVLNGEVPSDVINPQVISKYKQ